MTSFVELPRQIVTAITANAALVAGRHTPVDATAGPITVTLPASATPGATLSVEKRDSSTNAVIVSGTILGTVTTTTMALKHSSITFTVDASGTSWVPTAGRISEASVSATYVAKGALVFNVMDYGAIGDGATDDTTAIQSAINAATAAQGIVYLPAKTFAYGGLTLPKGVSLVGTHIPSADPTTLGTGSTLYRTKNVVGISMIGTDRSTNRIGANRIEGIRFTEVANVSAQPTINTKYADTVVWRDVTFWQTSTTTVGHAIAAEECWDWRFVNIIQKGCGNAAANKYGIYIYNGAVNNCDDWYFLQCRFQESGGTSIYFDSSGTGVRNTFFHFSECKFEDARTVGIRTATTHVNGDASNVTFFQTQFGGSLTAHALVGTNATAWVWSACIFANLADGAAQSLLIQGPNCKITASHFNSMNITQLMNITAGNTAVIGCTQSGTATVFNTGLPTTTLVLNPQLGASALGGAPNAFTGLQIGPVLAGATSQYGLLSNPTFGSDGTSSVQALAAQAKTAASAYTAANVYGVRALDAVKGAGSTISAQVGIQVDNQTQGANNFAIRTGTGVVSLGDVLELTAAATNRGAGKVGLGNGTQTTVGAAGAASTLPSAPLGYLVGYVNGTKIALPYFNA